MSVFRMNIQTFYILSRKTTVVLVSFQLFLAKHCSLVNVPLKMKKYINFSKINFY